ncbi:MAG: DMT family transporter [Rhodomicrobium sp.]
MRSFFNRPRLLLTLTAAFWGGNMVLGRAIVGVIPPVSLACLRWVLATLIFLPFAWPYLRKDAGEIWRNRLIILFLGFIGPACYNTFSYLGLVSTEALNGLVLSAAGPMFIAVTAWGIFGDRLDTAQLVGMAAGFAGVILVVAKGDLLSLAAFKFNSGDILVLAGVTAWSIYTVFLRKRPPISWQSYNLVTYAIAAIANVPAAFAERALGYTMSTSWVVAAAIFYVAIFPSVIAYIFYNRAVELLGPAPAGLYLFLIPVFGALLAMPLLGEKPHFYHAAGFALIIAGVIMGSRKSVVAPLPAEEAPG